MPWTSHAKIAGHPLHPILIVMPLGASIAATLAGAVHLMGMGPKNLPLHEIHYFNLLFTLGSGVIAAVPGMIDTLYLPPNTRAKRVAWVHGIGNWMAMASFGAAAYIQSQDRSHKLDVKTFAFTFVGFALSGITGFLGGELCSRLGVSVDRTANLNAKLSVLYGDSPDKHERMTLNLSNIFATDHAVRDKASEVAESVQDSDIGKKAEETASKYGLRSRA